MTFAGVHRSCLCTMCFFIWRGRRTVHLPAPKCQYAKDIVFDTDTPIFCTGPKHELVSRLSPAMPWGSDGRGFNWLMHYFALFSRFFLPLIGSGAELRTMPQNTSNLSLDLQWLSEKRNCHSQILRNSKASLDTTVFIGFKEVIDILRVKAESAQNSREAY